MNRRSRSRQWLAVAVLLAVGAAACGGSEDPTLDAADDPSPALSDLERSCAGRLAGQSDVIVWGRYESDAAYAAQRGETFARIAESCADVAEDALRAGLLTLLSEDEADRVLAAYADRPAGETSEPYAGDLTYAWPRDCRVAISERFTKNRSVADLRYEMTLSSLPGGGLALDFSDLVIDAVDDRAVPAAASDGLSAGLFVPGFEVNAAGEVTGLRDFGRYLRELEALGGDAGPAVDGENLLESSLRASVTGSYWFPWVGYWLELGTIEAGETVLDTEVVVSDIEVPTQVTYESLPVTPGRARLVFTSTQTGDEISRALERQVETLFGRDVRYEVTRRTHVEVETDPATLMPSVVDLDNDVSLIADGELVTDREIRHVEFDWAGSNCELG